MVQFQHGVCCLPADVFHSILAHSVLPRSIMCGLFDPPDATKDPYMGFIANEIISISEDEADVETMASTMKLSSDPYIDAACCADAQGHEVADAQGHEVADAQGQEVADAQRNELEELGRSWRGLSRHWQRKYYKAINANRVLHQTVMRLRDQLRKIRKKYPKQPAQPPPAHLIAKGKATMPRLPDPSNAFAPRILPPTVTLQRRLHPAAKCSQFGNIPIGASPRQIAKLAPPTSVEPA